MADKETRTRSSKSNMEKAEGNRWTSDPDTVEVSDRYAEGSGKTNENIGGVSNRPLEEEIDRQHDLPDRTRRNAESGEGDVER